MHVHNHSANFDVIIKDIEQISGNISRLTTSNREAFKKINVLRVFISNWQKSEDNDLQQIDIESIQKIYEDLTSIAEDLADKEGSPKQDLLKISKQFKQHIQSFIKERQAAINGEAARTYGKSPSLSQPPTEEEKTYGKSPSLSQPPTEEQNEPLKRFNSQERLDPEIYAMCPPLDRSNRLPGYDETPGDIEGKPTIEYAPSGAETPASPEDQENATAEIKFSTAAPWVQNLTKGELEDQPIAWPPIRGVSSNFLKRSKENQRNFLKTSIEMTESSLSLLADPTKKIGAGKDKDVYKADQQAIETRKDVVEEIRQGFKDQSPESKGLVIQDNREQVLRAYLPLSKVIAKKIYKVKGSKNKSKIKDVSDVLSKYGFNPENPKTRDERVHTNNQNSLRSALEKLYSEGTDGERKIVRKYISWYIGEHLVEKFPVVLVFDKAAKASGGVKEDIIKQESKMVDTLTDRIEEARMYLNQWKKIQKVNKFSKEEATRIENALQEIIEWQTYLVRNKMVVKKDESQTPTGAMSPLYALGSLDGVDPTVLDGYELRDGFKDLAEAMWVAHQLGILHNDISTRNIFVTLVMKKISDSKGKKEGEVVFKFGLGDWGLAQLADESRKGAADPKSLRPIKWLAPESFILQESSNSYELSDKTDVWAFGITLVEKASGNLSDFLGIFDIGADGFAQQLTHEIRTQGDNASGPNTFMMKRLARFQMDETQKVKFTPEAVELLKRIFENNPENRLNAHEIARFLEEMKKHGTPLYTYGD